MMNVNIDTTEVAKKLKLKPEDGWTDIEIKYDGKNLKGRKAGQKRWTIL